MTAPAVDTRPTDTDLTPETAAAALRLPCRVSDPDLWFAESPADLEQAKALCAGARCVRRVSRRRSSAPSRGACGVARSSTRGPSSPVSVRGDVRARTLSPRERQAHRRSGNKLTAA